MSFVNNALFYATLAGLTAWLLAEGQYGVVIAGVFVGVLLQVFLWRQHDQD